jgi:Domain of unknown function (DUF4105)
MRQFLLRFPVLPLLLFMTFYVRAQDVRTLSPKAQISLITVAPGEELYSTFGHSALRISDPEERIDRVYNYGTFDFDQPNFYVNFCRGKLLYSLDIESNKGFQRSNLEERRYMREQVLALNDGQKARLFNMLEDNALAENRNYKYDFFYDNCATRIRDIVNGAMYDQARFDTAGIAKGVTLRQLLRPYLMNHPWTRFGIDLVLGVPADRLATVEQAMFLPDGLHDGFAKALMPDGQRLVSGENRVPFQGYENPAVPSSGPGMPFWTMCLVAVIGVLTMWNERSARIFDTVFWFVLGVAGLIITFLWFFTDHGATKTNLNLFWALPTHLLFFYRRKRTAATELYFMAAAVVAALMLFAWTVLPQELPLPALPLLVLIIVKGFWKKYKS